MTSHLPKAYLRIDPNLDHTHPDPGLFVRLLCAAARQPTRGYFKDLHVLESSLGRRAAQRLVSRGDVVAQEDGRLWVDGWDIWQEGDLTVQERMRRYRNKQRIGGVTGASPDRNTVTPPHQPSSPSSPSDSPNNPTSQTEDVETAGARALHDAPNISQRDGDKATYCREVYGAFCRAIGQERHCSSVEFAQAVKWWDAGVPLRVILRAIQDCLEKRSDKRPRSLLYVAPAVDEALAGWKQNLAMA